MIQEDERLKQTLCRQGLLVVMVTTWRQHGFQKHIKL